MLNTIMLQLFKCMYGMLYNSYGMNYLAYYYMRYTNYL